MQFYVPDLPEHKKRWLLLLLLLLYKRVTIEYFGIVKDARLPCVNENELSWPSTAYMEGSQLGEPASKALSLRGTTFATVSFLRFLEQAWAFERVALTLGVRSTMSYPLHLQEVKYLLQHRTLAAASVCLARKLARATTVRVHQAVGTPPPPTSSLAQSSAER